MESWDDYDHAAYDDDGQPIADEETDEALIPYDPSKTYTETEAITLTAFAGTYRDVRGKAQMDRFKKKAQKNAKGAGKSQKKSVSKPRSFAFKKWKKTTIIRPEGEDRLQGAVWSNDSSWKSQ